MALVDLTANAIDGKEPQRVNNILLHFTLPNSISLPNGTTNASLDLSVESFPIPGSSISPFEVSRLNETRKFAGRPSFAPMQVVYKDFVNFNVAGLLAAWRDLAYNPANGQVGWAATSAPVTGGIAIDAGGYKCQGYVILYPPDGTQTASGDVRQWNLYGCWLSDFEPGQANQSEQGQVFVSCTIQIDKAVLGAYGTPDLSSFGF